MALLDAELRRVKYELGYNLVGVGAEPWIGYSALFENLIQPYLSAGASTTSTTSVSAVDEGEDPALATVTLASGTGFAAGARVVVDVDAFQEVATVRSISGAVATMFLSLAHSGTYPVTVEGGETIVREILARIREVAGQLDEAAGAAGVKKVDEIEFFGSAGARRREELQGLREYWREELASALGVPYLRGVRETSVGGGIAVM